MPNAQQPLSFPKRFFWGASTSAHQVEGGNHNQWSVWELENASRLAKESKKYPPDNYISGEACDHYNRYQEDFSLMKSMNMNSFRFSIEWSRIEPKEGVWDAEAIQHYRDYFQALKKQNIEPFVTLWHWTVPVWFANKGGFVKRRNVKYFVRFAEKVFAELGREFRYVVTINEPETYVHKGYLDSEWPPQVCSKAQTLRVYCNLAYAHKKVYRLAHKTSRRFIVGLAKNSAHIYPGDDARLSRWSASVATWAGDYFFLDKIKNQLDFIGLNHYFSYRIYGYRAHNPEEKQSDLEWDMQPQNIQFVLERLHKRYGLPIIITENGCADGEDKSRQWWLQRTIMAMHKALQNGVNLQGYLHWSLLDNFEWAYGFWPRFGLIAVDYKTQKRTPRSSAIWFAKIIGQMRGK